MPQLAHNTDFCRLYSFAIHRPTEVSIVLVRRILIMSSAALLALPAAALAEPAIVAPTPASL